MGGTRDLTEIEQQLLMAAAVHRLGPDADLGRANTARVVDQVLRWRGLSVEQVRSGWREEDCDPDHELVYGALIRMIHQTDRKGTATTQAGTTGAVRGSGQLGSSQRLGSTGMLASIQLMPADRRGRAVGPRAVEKATAVWQHRRTAPNKELELDRCTFRRFGPRGGGGPEDFDSTIVINLVDILAERRLEAVQCIGRVPPTCDIVHQSDQVLVYK